MKASRASFIGILLSILGIVLCAYLTFIHIALLRGELFGGAACGSEGSIFNCHSVSASPFSFLFGIPLSLWGLVGYLATLSLSIISFNFPERRFESASCLFGLSLLFLAMDALLFAIMVFNIRQLCPICIATYAVNFGLLIISKQILSAPFRKWVSQLKGSLGLFLPFPREAVSWIAWGIVVTGTAGIVSVNAVATYASQGSPEMLRKQIEQYMTGKPRMSVETGSDPVKGSLEKGIKTVVFSDFLCPSCQKASKFEEIIFAAHRNDVAFVFKNLPLDMECNDSITRTLHPGACRIAAASECASEQGRFWPFHDLTFSQEASQRIMSLEKNAAAVGLDLEKFKSCMESGKGMNSVKQDVAEAARYKITSTPTYLIDGLPFSGSITPSMFQALLKILKESKQPL